MIKVLRNPNGVTVAELREWLAAVPTLDPETEEPNTVWLETGTGLSNPVREVWPLNARTSRGRIVSCDVCLKWEEQ